MTREKSLNLRIDAIVSFDANAFLFLFYLNGC